MTITYKFFIFLEINQTWDWNNYWTNNKYKENQAYQESAQPALVYKAEIDPLVKGKPYSLKLIGYSHPLSDDGTINPDISTFTTALNILESITIILK